MQRILIRSCSIYSHEDAASLRSKDKTPTIKKKVIKTTKVTIKDPQNKIKDIKASSSPKPVQSARSAFNYRSSTSKQVVRKTKPVTINVRSPITKAKVPKNDPTLAPIKKKGGAKNIFAKLIVS